MEKQFQKLQQLLETLKRGNAFPHKTKNIEFIETHISWIFLTGDFVYKIKKPVKFSFLDFSTLEKRKFFCEQELLLNRRLSPEIYLSVEGVYEKNDELNFRKEGNLVDYAVKLKQLPKEKKMDLLLKQEKVYENDVQAIAKIISEFHKKAKIINDKNFASSESVQKQIDDITTVKEVIERELGLEEKIDELLSLCDSFITENKKLMISRQSNGFVKECHGDLHSANIFLADKIYIFDCIEFNEAFRYIDTASEIAFMAMDLDYFGKEKLSKSFVQEYISLSGDKELLKLLNLYKSYRANVRCKVAALELHSGLSKGHKKDVCKRIENYLNLALKYAKQL